MARPDTRILTHAVAARLAGVTNATGYYTEIGCPLPGTATAPATPPTVSSDDTRVAPYFIYTPAGRGTGPDAALSGGDTGGLYAFTVTAAAGDADSLLELVDRIENRVLRWTPAAAGVSTGPVTHPIGFQPSTVLTDREVTPHRFFIQLQFQFHATL